MLTGVKDIDLLIASKLNDSDIEELDKCITLKGDTFWKSRLMIKYKLIIESPLKNWGKYYIDHGKFVEFFHLTLCINLLKDHYSNNFSLNYLLFVRKNFTCESFYPLLSSILNFLNQCKTDLPSDFHDYLIKNKSYLSYAQKMYENVYYVFPYPIRMGGSFFETNFLNEYFSSLMLKRILLRNELFPYSMKIDSKGILNIDFKSN